TGRGSNASAAMRRTMRWRSFLRPSASISFPADGFISSLYAATLSQATDEGVERNASLRSALVKCREVFGILGQRGLYGVIHHLGNRAIGGSSLQPQRLVNVGVEIDSGAFQLHHGAITL